MIRARRARIVATLGPASRGTAQVRELALAGADVFRVNFSHGAHADHARTIADGPRRRGRRSAGRWPCWPTCRARSSGWASSPTARCG